MKIIYVETVYSLLLALILLDCDLDEILILYHKLENKNLLKVKMKFKNTYEIRDINLEKNKLKGYIEEYKNVKELEKVLNRDDITEIYLHDHIKKSNLLLNLIKKKDIFLIEDGTSNYSEKNINKEFRTIQKDKYKEKNIILRLKIWTFKKFISKSLKNYQAYGISEKIKKIYLTGLLPIPDAIKNKVELFNIFDKWEKLESSRKRDILKLFDINTECLQNIENDREEKVLLLTQPLSEDRIITEEEKIEIYKNIIQEKKLKKLYLKAHPREKTEYEKVLKKFGIEIVRIENSFPIELLKLLKIEFSKVITIFSTAALNFKNSSEIEFIGTEKYPKLYEVFGKIKNRK